jgi:putative hemolysin
VSLATTEPEIAASQRLRFDVFCTEMGARLPRSVDGQDIDEFDEHCLHLLLTDPASGRLAGSTRLLLSEGARAAGMFCSESRFDLGPVLALPGRFMEVSRTCIHRDYRSGATISALWNGIAEQVFRHDVDYLIGCAGLPMDNEGSHAQAIVERIRDHYFTSSELRVEPRLPLHERPPFLDRTSALLPALLQAYLRLGARVGGEACWDPEFHVADVFMMLECARLDPRSVRTYLQCA